MFVFVFLDSGAGFRSGVLGQVFVAFSLLFCFFGLSFEWFVDLCVFRWFGVFLV